MVEDDPVRPIRADADAKMQKTLDSLRTNLATIRAGRAASSILDRVIVNYHGFETPLPQLASISTPSTNLIQIEPYDKSSIVEIEKAIVKSNLGLTPSTDGNLIRITMPPMTEERRRQLVKVAKEMAEDARVALRNIRRTAVDAVKKREKASDLSKDQSADAQDELTKMVKKYEGKVDEMMKVKEKEITTV